MITSASFRVLTVSVVHQISKKCVIIIMNPLKAIIKKALSKLMFKSTENFIVLVPIIESPYSCFGEGSEFSN